jgi:hypothetical protein
MHYVFSTKIMLNNFNLKVTRYFITVLYTPNPIYPHTSHPASTTKWHVPRPPIINTRDMRRTRGSSLRTRML